MYASVSMCGALAPRSLASPRSTSFVLALLLASGCVESEPQAPRVVVGQAEILLDSREGATLTGRVEPVLPNSDADRVLVLRADMSGPLGEALDGTRALDARFVAGGAAVLGVDRVLRFVAPDGSAAALAGEAYGPLSVAGERVAFVRGAPPDLELARANVRTGAVEQLTQAMAPVWSPALSPDGAEVVFVSGAGGSPRLFRLGAAGEVAILPATERVPSAPTAPRWRGSTLIFEDERGVAFLDLRRGAMLGDVPRARGLSVRADGTPQAMIEGRLQPLTLPRGVR